jgi:hypothetical protein
MEAAMTDDVRTTWQQQTPEATMIDIRNKTDHLNRFFRFRNRAEYAAAVLVVVAFTYAAIHYPGDLFRVGCALIIAATIYVALYIRDRAGVGEAPGSATVADTIAFHRGELVRQRDLMRGVVWWYVAPFVPGITLFLAGMTENGLMERGASLPVRLGIVAAVTVAIWLLNLFGASRVQRQIDALDRVRTT